MEHLVKLVTPEGGLVLDPHGGSGTTGVACINTGRRYILIDEDAYSVDIAERRCQSATIERNSKLFAA
jgi:site-specific DNA-methyltransferase (adenine-specific)